MPWLEQCVTAELIAGNMKVNICYLVPAGQSREMPLQLGVPGVVPVLNNVSPEALADHLKGTHAMMLDFDGAKICLVLPAQASALTALVDGDHELAEICRHLRKAEQNYRRAPSRHI